MKIDGNFKDVKKLSNFQTDIPITAMNMVTAKK